MLYETVTLPFFLRTGAGGGAEGAGESVRRGGRYNAAAHEAPR